jgi:hypothetical protein
MVNCGLFELLIHTAACARASDLHCSFAAELPTALMTVLASAHLTRAAVLLPGPLRCQAV